MLYLIRSFGRGGKSYLKVGYSDSLGNRMGQYRIHNPLFELIATREGSQEDELLIHLYLEALGYKVDILNEWFMDTPEILSRFHDNIQSKVLRKVWRNRESLFTIADFNNPLRKKIFERLRSTFGKSRKYSIDREWAFADSREKLKKVKNLDIDLLL